ncbi:MAG TPA: anthranilate synthase component I, partial [Alphaproteobacteria bacterium]|nr:anthranilate synthase component I [Alphaproteobacteria bacterium]
DLIWRCRGNDAEINRHALIRPDAFELCSQGSLDSLRALIDECKIPDLPPKLPPMASSLVGYLGYDMVRLVEHLPNTPPDTLGLPDGMFIRPTVMAVFDGVEDRITLVAPVRPHPGMDAAKAYEIASERLAEVVRQLEQPLPASASALSAAAPESWPEPVANMSRQTFEANVIKAREYIHAGDAFQIVPSQRFRVPFELPPFALYRALRRLNPSPFLFFFNLEGFSIVGSSPEILVRVRNGHVTIRPLAGTRRRGASAAEDRALAEELQNDPKELAEHLMLLDLARNDVGRVAKIGSVEVTAQFEVEYYSHVMHLSSTVEGELDPSYDAFGALMAGFPAGTLSGAPKVRAMEIIDELEPEKRGIYAGCIGYFAADGSMDTCIGLRTALVKDDVMYVQAGVGVVADSKPEAEYQESVDKAAALVRAAGEAVRFAPQ